MTRKRDIIVVTPRIKDLQAIIDKYDDELAGIRIDIAKAQIREDIELEKEHTSKGNELLKKRNAVVELKFEEA